MMVTVPHKQTVMPLLDKIDATAAAIGAVNCIVKRDGSLTGFNTDVYGFTRSLSEAGFRAAGCRALVLGAGGAAHAVAYGLAGDGAISITLANRTRSRAEQARAHLERVTGGSCQIGVIDPESGALAAACADVDLIVNCTSLGMRHGEGEGLSPLDSSVLRPAVWVYDTVYTPALTPLLRQAALVGARPVGGLEMLIYQAVRAVELWTDRSPPVAVMRSAAREALGLEA
jgi:shikimate dehydrogenase